MFTKPAEFKYVELPFEAIAAAGAARQKRYDEGDKLTSDINDTFLKIGSREADTPRKQELVNDYQKQIYDVVDSYSGDIGAALPKIKELQRKINYDMAYGELGAIKKNYEAEQTRIKVVQDSNQNYNEGKGGLDAFDATNLLEFEKQLNAGPTKKVGNTWSTYQTHSLSATQDYSKAAREIADKIDIQTLENFSGMKHVGNGIFMDEKRTTEVRDKDIIAEYVTNALLSDPKYSQYLDWKNTISGKKSAVARTLQNDVVTTPDGVQYLAQKDAAGNEVAAINPTEWANETLISDFRNAGQSAGEIYQRLKVTRDRKYATPDLSGGKEEAPALGLNVFATPLAVHPVMQNSAEQLKSSVGTVVDSKTGQIKSDAGGSVVGKRLEQAWAGLKFLWGYTAGAMNKNFNIVQGGVPGTVQQKMATVEFFDDLENISTKYDNPYESANQSAALLRKQYPTLNIVPAEKETRILSDNKSRDGKKLIFDPNDPSTWWVKPGDKEATYDKNSGILINATTQALTKAAQQAGNITTLPAKNTQAVQDYFVKTQLIGNESFGTLVTPANPKNPELAKAELTADTDGKMNDIQFVGISDAFSGSKLVFKVNGKTALYQPSDQFSNAKLQVSQAVSESYANQKPQKIELNNGNYLIVQPDIVPETGNTFLPDGSNARYAVNIIQVDKNNNPVNFREFNTNVIPAEVYYQEYELPTFLQTLGVK